jgi:hypothetical protein
MSETEAKAVLSEAIASGRQQKMEAGAEALRHFVHGTRATTPDAEE